MELRRAFSTCTLAPWVKAGTGPCSMHAAAAVVIIKLHGGGGHALSCMAMTSYYLETRSVSKSLIAWQTSTVPMPLQPLTLANVSTSR